MHRRAFVALALFVVASTSAACFDAPEPAGVVLCTSDGDCASSSSKACDLGAHVCVEKGTKAPRVQAAVFDPVALSSGIARLTITADQALSTTSPPAVTFAAGSASLALSPASVAGAKATIDVDVTGANEGVYTVASIDLTSAGGSRGHSELEAVALVVDRTPPAIFNAAIVNQPAAGFADVDLFNVIDARFSANEALASATFSLDATSVPCTVSDTQATCTFHIANGSEGTFDASVAAVDVAGNTATQDLGPVVVHAPPAVAPGSVSVRITVGNSVVEKIVPGAHLDVALSTTEQLTGAPQIRFADEPYRDAIAFTSTASSAGTDFAFAADVPASLTLTGDGDDLVATLVDRFARSVDSVVANLPFAVVTTCPPAPGFTCIDVDGDGFPAITPACPNAPDVGDPDDGDATIFPGMPELPGDGKDNGGSGFDLPIDENSGVFVDSEQGADSSSCGTRASPCQSLAAAQQSGGSSLFFYLAARATPYAGGINTGLFAAGGMVGGLDPATWQRTSSQSRFEDTLCADPGFIFDSIVRTASLVVDGGCAAEDVPRVVLVRSTLATMQDGGSLIIDSDVGDLEMLGNAITTVVGGTLGVISVADENAATGQSLTLEHVAVTGAVDVNSSQSLTAINSRFLKEIFLDSFGGNVTLFHSTVVTDGATPIAASIDLHSGNLTVVDSVLARADVGPVISSDGSGSNDFFALIVGSDLSSGGGDAIVLRDGSGGIADIGTSTLPGVTGHDNIAVPPQIDSFRLQPGSPLVGAATNTNAEALGAPASVAADFDGQCRYADAAPDIGADEAQ